MAARPYLLLLAVVCMLAIVFVAAGCEKKNDAPAAPIDPPGGNSAAAGGGAEIRTLPPDDGYGSPRDPVGSRPRDGTAGTGGTGGTAGPGSEAAPPTGTTTHKMKKGDTIMGLCRLYYGPAQATNANVKKIMDANPKYKDPTKIPVGAEIVIPK